MPGCRILRLSYTEASTKVSFSPPVPKVEAARVLASLSEAPEKSRPVTDEAPSLARLKVSVPM